MFLSAATELKQTCPCTEADAHIYRLVARSLPGVAIYVYGPALQCLAAEGALLSPEGQSVEGLPDLLSDSGARLTPHLERALQGHTTSCEYALDQRIFQLEIVPVRDDASVVVAGMVVSREVTRERRRERDLERAAWIDPVTCLHSRAGILAVVREIEEWRRAAVLTFDLDGFKAINDTYGHLVGDQVLREVGNRIQSCLRGHDRAARMGGDEFVALLPAVRSFREAERIARRVVEAVRAPMVLPGQLEVAVTASAGVAMARPHENFEALLARADAALYTAKRAGKNLVRSTA